MFDIVFLKDLLSNLCATFVGAVLGIFTGLWLNNKNQRKEEDSRANNLVKEAKEREGKILQLITDELKWNTDILKKVQNSKSAILFFEDREYENLYQLKTELWNVFSDGGELQWIDDVNLLHSIAQTYDTLRMVLQSEILYTTFVLNASIKHETTNDWPPFVKLHEKRLFNRMHERIRFSLDSLANTLTMVDEKILKYVTQSSGNGFGDHD